MTEAQRVPVAGSFTATGASSHFVTRRGFNLSLSGFGTATVELQRSFDQGATWLTVKSYTAAVERVVDDPEHGVYYRLECTSYSSGTILYRMSG